MGTRRQAKRVLDGRPISGSPQPLATDHDRRIVAAFGSSATMFQPAGVERNALLASLRRNAYNTVVHVEYGRRTNAPGTTMAQENAT